ncbi:MAG: Holliday junction branch migration protein RuvA, partial [Gemmatimonadales bacterium]
RRRRRRADARAARVIAGVSGRVAARHGDRVLIQTPGGVAYEVIVPLGVMERLPAVGAPATLVTEQVVREDGAFLYGFLEDRERRFFQRLVDVSGVGPRIAVALLSALGVERGAKAVEEKNIALLASVNGIGKKTAERLALELAGKLDEFVGGPGPAAGPPQAALHALERLGYATADADRALRQVLSDNGAARGADVEALVRRALQLLALG